ncbi:MAG: anhydro-N-acetylmuramic acid kinase [Alphaproteobacteria bacterium]|nr:anhydro-N-acetylmuramic acid kinase [Alphaproteobacteria bacterium]
MPNKVYRSIGLMSGTSLDGVDAALIETDGRTYVKPKAFVTRRYQPDFRAKLRKCFGNRQGAKDRAVAAVGRRLTELHAAAVLATLKKAGLKPADIDLVGFHGQTIWHRPQDGVTCQIGDGKLLAKLTGIPVVNDFRRADIEAGGHGAPMVPLFHAAKAVALPKPLAIINIGGVANITWLDARGGIYAFDTGPGGALIDDWVLRKHGKPKDVGGRLAARGKVDWNAVHKFWAHPYFLQPIPKSLDRDEFKKFLPKRAKLTDGAATVTMMSAMGICHAFAMFEEQPTRVLVTGGGRHNKTLMEWLSGLLGRPVQPVEAVKWNGDALEAQAFAYLAVRSKLKLPLTLPTTTGVRKRMTGGVLHKP